MDLNTLHAKETYDEHTNRIIEYIDKQGKTVLKRVQATTSQTSVNDTNYASTYYIHDDFGNLVAVLPPEAVAKVTDYHGYSSADKETFLRNWAFRYKYDGRKRLIEKWIPSTGTSTTPGVVYMVYDDRDRLVLTQDANQRSTSTKYWTFTKYDELNRPILTGIKDTAASLTQSEMQAAVNAHYQKSWAKWGERYIGNSTENIHGYTNKSYPVRTSGAATDPNDYITVTYYDNYLFRDGWTDEFDYVNDGLTQTVNGVIYAQPDTEFPRVKGQVTGISVKALDDGIRGGQQWLNTINYFDDRYRIIQTISENFKGGTDRITNLYDFSGKVLQTKTRHSTHLVTWKDMVASGITANKLYKSITGSGWNTAGAASVEQLGAGQDGWLEVTISEITKSRMIGLSDQNTDNDNTINFAFHVGGTNLLTIYENGTDIVVVSNAYQASDRLKIARTGTTIRYYINDNLVHTSATASSSALMADVAFYTSNASVVNVRSSFSASYDSITRRFEYDHAGRLEKTWHQINSQPEILLSYLQYNELGQLIDKKLHSTSATANDSRQSIDYRYNIRGWLAKMNEVDLSNGDSGDPYDYFSMELGYNKGIGIGNSFFYNGNISGMKWSSNLGLSDEKMKGYVYTYDTLNRITSATFKEGSGNLASLTWAAPSGDAFSVSGINYDLNGNIQGLTRKGIGGADMDILEYRYGSGITQSNQLERVIDTGDDQTGFTELNTTGNDHIYDGNGNMTWDRNKGGKELLINGDFTNGSANWVVTDPGGRLTFENGSLNIALNSSGATLAQNDIIQPGSLGYVVIIDMQRTSATGSITIDVGGTAVSVSNSGKSMLNVKGGGGKNFTVTIPANAFEGSINSIEVKGLVVIRYNFLNLPESVTKGGDHYMNYYYDAIGRKLAQEVFTSANVLEKRSDYSGEYFYENDTLKFINHEEGRVVMTGSQPEYQYHLKDHLGNVRLTFTTKQEAETFTASFESNTQVTEQATFQNYSRNNLDLFDHTDAGTVYTFSQLLNGGNNSQVGLAKTLSVMPGDTIKAEVYAKYRNLSSTSGNLAGFASALTAAFGLNASNGW